MASNPQLPDRLGTSTTKAVRPTDWDMAAMIDAEVNEGGPPSSIPCDASAESKSLQGASQIMRITSPRIEACPAPDRVLHLPLGNTVGGATSSVLMTSDRFELIRLVIPAGKEIPPHRVPGEITVQCIEGHVCFEHDGRAIDLMPGDLLHLCPQEMHTLRGLADSSVLVTRIRPRGDELPETV